MNKLKNKHWWVQKSITDSGAEIEVIIQEITSNDVPKYALKSSNVLEEIKNETH